MSKKVYRIIRQPLEDESSKDYVKLIVKNSSPSSYSFPSSPSFVQSSSIPTNNQVEQIKYVIKKNSVPGLDNFYFSNNNHKNRL